MAERGPFTKILRVTAASSLVLLLFASGCSSDEQNNPQVQGKCDPTKDPTSFIPTSSIPGGPRGQGICVGGILTCALYGPIGTLPPQDRGKPPIPC